MWENSLKLFTTGLLMGIGPCLGHCAPFLLSYVLGTKKGWKDGLKTGAYFIAGQIFALFLLGIIATLAFRFINKFTYGLGVNYLYLILGIFILLMGIFVILKKELPIPGKIKIYQYLLNKSIPAVSLVGFLMGIIPCGYLLGILAYISAISNNFLEGGMYAGIYGLGSMLPLIAGTTITGIIPGVFSSARSKFILRMISGTILIIFGIQLFLFPFRKGG